MRGPRPKGAPLWRGRGFSLHPCKGLRQVSVLKPGIRPSVVRMILGVTGHRPPRLGMPYDDKTLTLTFTAFASDVLRDLVARRVESVISGMALGWDQAVAEAALELKIPLIAAVPFEGFSSRWSKQAQKRFQRILDSADKVVVVCGEDDRRSHTQKYLARDRYIVDHCGLLLAMWDGEKTGGTWQTVKYAQAEKVTIQNVFNRWNREGRPGVSRG